MSSSKIGSSTTVIHSQSAPVASDLHVLAEKSQAPISSSMQKDLEAAVPPGETVDVGVDNNSTEDGDEVQAAKVAQIVDDIESVRAAWWSYREQVFNQLKLDDDLRESIQQTREKTYISLENLADHMREANEDQRDHLVKSMAQISRNYEIYTQRALGAERFAYLRRAQSQFNEQLKKQTDYQSQIVGDW